MDENNSNEGSVPQQSDATDLVIAEAVEVMLTMYSCRFCSKRFDTIDKVKTHFLKRHSVALDSKSVNDGNDESIENESQIDESVAQNDSIDEIEGQEVEAEEGMDETNDNEEENNEETDKKTTIVIKQQKMTQKVNRSKIKMIETERSIQSRTRLKKDLPNHLELKIVRPDNTAIDLPPKRGRPKKYEVRQSSQSKTATRRYPCPFSGCDYIAKYRSNLWDHKKLHTGEKPYQCNWPNCLSRFPQSQQLKLHLRSHTGERPYSCTWPGCELAFSQKPGLKSHMRTHTGEKPYVCDWPGCEWKFRLKGALTDHKKAVHEGLKGFVCEWPGCNKRFLQSCHLRKHMMAHADIKPFACDWPNCNYKAVSMSYVTNHKKTHTGEKNFECGYNGCTKRFVKGSHVLRHQQKCHPELTADQTIIDGSEEVEVYNISTIEI